MSGETFIPWLGLVYEYCILECVLTSFPKEYETTVAYQPLSRLTSSLTTRLNREK